MTVAELEALVAEGESHLLEFKKTTAAAPKAAATVCAMLNGAGGIVLIGVTDRGRILGQQFTDSSLRGVTSELRKIDPQAVLQPDHIPLPNGHVVLAIHVPVGNNQPYTHDGRAFVRVGSETTLMDRATYQHLLFSRQAPADRWEAQPAAGLTLDDLDHAEITRTVDEAIRRGRMDEPGTRDPTDLLLGLDLLRGGRITNAAVVLFGNDPHKLGLDYPQCLLRMARFRGTTMDAFEDNRRETGHVFELFRRAQRFLRDHLPIAGRVVPNLFERADDPLYPPEALREALANAFVHRDYTAGGGSVGLAVFDNRLEISSTGTLPAGIGLADLKQKHASKPRNGLIANVFYRRGIIETWGRGTLKILELSERAGLQEPEFEERSGEVVVRFLPTRYVAPSRLAHDLSPLQQEILQVLGDHGSSRLSDIIRRIASGAAERTVQENLNLLRGLDLVHLKGRGRGARWSLIE